MFAGFHYARHLGVEHLESIDPYDGEDPRHFVREKVFPDEVIHEQHSGLGMVYKVMYVACLEIGEDRHGHGSVSNGCQEADCPVNLVLRADGYLVTFVQEAFLERDVKFFYAPCYVSVTQRGALVVGQRHSFPVLSETVLQKFVNGFELKFSHVLFLYFKISFFAIVASSHE
jgi:hypothetical protein